MFNRTANHGHEAIEHEIKRVGRVAAAVVALRADLMAARRGTPLQHARCLSLLREHERELNVALDRARDAVDAWRSRSISQHELRAHLAEPERILCDAMDAIWAIVANVS